MKQEMGYQLAVFLGIVISTILTSSPASGSDLAAYRWKNRVLLLFAPTDSDPGFQDFDRMLAMQRSEKIDRDLIVYRVFEKDLSTVERQPLSPKESQKLRRRFNVVTGRFTVILIGKDGGTKLVRHDSADLQEIFDLIDSMPMRQQEMREKETSR